MRARFLFLRDNRESGEPLFPTIVLLDKRSPIRSGTGAQRRRSGMTMEGGDGGRGHRTASGSCSSPRSPRLRVRQEGRARGDAEDAEGRCGRPPRLLPPSPSPHPSSSSRTSARRVRRAGIHAVTPRSAGVRVVEPEERSQHGSPIGGAARLVGDDDGGWKERAAMTGRPAKDRHSCANAAELRLRVQAAGGSHPHHG